MVYDTAGQYLLMIYSLAIVCAEMRNSLKAINNSEKMIIMVHEFCVSKIWRHVDINAQFYHMHGPAVFSFTMLLEG